MLQSPGFNVATLGVVLMVVVQVALILTWKTGGQEALDRVYAEGGLTWAGVSGGKVW